VRSSPALRRTASRFFTSVGSPLVSQAPRPEHNLPVVPNTLAIIETAVVSAQPPWRKQRNGARVMASCWRRDQALETTEPAAMGRTKRTCPRFHCRIIVPLPPHQETPTPGPGLAPFCRTRRVEAGTEPHRVCLAVNHLAPTTTSPLPRRVASALVVCHPHRHFRARGRARPARLRSLTSGCYGGSAKAADTSNKMGSAMSKSIHKRDII